MTERATARDPVRILLADDDPDDQLLVQEALGEAGLEASLTIVSDGVELLEYLRREGAYADRAGPQPSLILLDLNMPRKDGREALREIKSSAELRRIPVVVLTTSKADDDALRAYDLGVNSFVVKPVSFDGLVKVMRNLAGHWFEDVKLPPGVTSV